MGFRAQMVTKYEVEIGDCLGFNHSYDKFTDFLDELGVNYLVSEFSDEYHEIETESLLALTEQDIERFKDDEEKYFAVKSLIQAAKEYPYASKSGYVRVHWF